MKVLNRVSEAENVVSIVWERLRKEAQAVSDREELMKPLLDDAILSHSSFWEALSFRLVTKLNGTLIKQAHWLKIFQEAYSLSIERDDVDLEHAACVDLAAIEERDPACDSYLTAFMFFKGYKALEIYRVSHVLWSAGRKELALLMQSRSSEVFSVDIHPAARIGSGLMIDHATGIVIGETAVVGNNCSFLHGVTLGGTGKDWGDRHPKVGHNVSIGCNASILGNIRINDDCKIGANSVVIREVPAGATAVGSPARLVGVVTPSPSSASLCLPVSTPTPTPSSSNTSNPVLSSSQQPLTASSSSATTIATTPSSPSLLPDIPISENKMKRSISFDVESNCVCCKYSKCTPHQVEGMVGVGVNLVLLLALGGLVFFI
eukprot:gene43827-53594_t